ncbi:hypothetical protein H5T56_06740 [Candidatus Bipolaricaulota bacterium]|nr:hypothetical protein [Candidatus Bipolaricaulota bacterium]
MAHRLAEEYWLYIVSIEPTGPKLWCIQNPARLPAEKKTVVQYLLEWENYAQPEEL